MADTTRPGDSLSSVDDVVYILLSCQGETPRPGVSDLYAALSRQWKAFARRRFSQFGVADIEDAVQDTWAKLIEPERLRRLEAMHRTRSFPNIRSFENWAFVIFRNTLLDNGRILRRREELLAEGEPAKLGASAAGEGLEAAAARREWLARIHDAVRSSRIRQGSYLFRACFVEGLSDEEVARTLGTTRDSVRGRRKRMRKLIVALGLGEGGS